MIPYIAQGRYLNSYSVCLGSKKIECHNFQTAKLYYRLIKKELERRNEKTRMG